MSYKSFNQLHGLVVSDLWLVLKPNIPNTFKMLTQRMCIEMHWNHIQNSNKTYSTCILNIFNTHREHTVHAIETCTHSYTTYILFLFPLCRHTQPTTTGITTSTRRIVCIQSQYQLYTNHESCASGNTIIVDKYIVDQTTFLLSI